MPDKAFPAAVFSADDFTRHYVNGVRVPGKTLMPDPFSPTWIIIDDLVPESRKQEQMSKYDCWEVAEAVIASTPRVLLRGKPGTGKTYHAVTAGLKPGQKVYSVTMTEETPAAEIRGHYVPKGNEFIWSDGPAIMAWREGARLVINEIDRSSEDVLSLLYAILDDPEFAALTLPTGETVRPAEGFSVVATMNGIPQDLPDALQDRLPVDIEITDVNPNAINRLPEDLREPARNTALAKSNARGISIRMWLEFASLREKLPSVLDDEEKGLELAAQAIFGPKAADALMALEVSKRASEAHDMTGTLFTELEVGFLEYIRTNWSTDYYRGEMPIDRANTSIKYLQERIRGNYDGFFFTEESFIVVPSATKPGFASVRLVMPDSTSVPIDSVIDGL